MGGEAKAKLARAAASAGRYITGSAHAAQHGARSTACHVAACHVAACHVAAGDAHHLPPQRRRAGQRRQLLRPLATAAAIGLPARAAATRGAAFEAAQPQRRAVLQVLTAGPRRRGPINAVNDEYE